MRNIHYPFLLDGGLSNQLESQGCDLNQPLWTAEMIRSNPEAIINAHLAYLEAGVQCIITSSYQASIDGFIRLGATRREAQSMILKSVQLAETAIREYLAGNPSKNRPLIAASVGPYGAYLADGSEYTGNYDVTDDQLYEFHIKRIQILDGSPADVLACETIPDYREAWVLSGILRDCVKDAWMTFSCRDEHHISDGTPITDCVRLLNDNASVFAVGINCTDPRFISPLIRKIRSTAANKKIVVYPNSGEMYRSDTRSWSGSGSPGFSMTLVQEWIDLGADIIGGCCRVGPEVIGKMAKVLKDV